MKIIDRPSPNFDLRKTPIDLVVLHYTGMKDAETALKRLTDPAPRAGDYPGPWQAADIDPNSELGRVSAHYVVGEDGVIYRVVDETARAWHAGTASWEGRGDVNSRAIGIEIANGGHDYGLPPYPDAQIAAVITLVGDILKRHRLAPDRVVAHSDIAPGRKDDPGEHFPWKRLADAGVSIWPGITPAPKDTVIHKRGDRGAGPHGLHASLAEFGYAAPEDADAESAVFSEQTEAIVRAFQRRFEPHRVDGKLWEDTWDALETLLAQRDDDDF